ncbi:ribulose-1,5 bisphosphate carboxylase/oxygenase large subunit N-methyltransferase, chloroplastic [Dorcoceras hygrometricum]|uniref:Ribulose-1,5 bisphosphate carboxylase/oxygenase large subunit N-methyltransferase, chloroplastic n=1 Tax=Dorcoceras hygrometricum TaxID=472368 RepID=A0A2Z7C833_9LAMI|nr:ribulose-1,5 bisphosphate carboxylase/oxygenase large subunit N-methyltransferase, chloroplastic [Dorcoceras hygrometricum]
MSLFDLQDVCIAIGSLTTLDLPMVVDLIGIYGLKGPYCTLTTTDWFLQALSVIPRGSWGDVARRFTMIRWAIYLDLHGRPPYLSSKASRRRPPPHVDRTFSDHHFEEFPSVLISSGPLVQADEGTLLPVVDLIRRNLPPPTVKSQSPCDSGWSQAPVASEAGRRRALRPIARAIARSTPCALAAHGGRLWPAAARTSLHAGRKMAAHVARPMAAAVRKLLRQRWPAVDASSCMVARWMCDGLRNVRRVSRQRAMADFSSSYVRACPEQPMKFSGRYSISGRFWSILKF